MTRQELIDAWERFNTTEQRLTDRQVVEVLSGGSHSNLALSRKTGISQYAIGLSTSRLKRRGLLKCSNRNAWALVKP